MTPNQTTSPGSSQPEPLSHECIAKLAVLRVMGVSPYWIEGMKGVLLASSPRHRMDMLYHWTKTKEHDDQLWANSP